MRDSRNHCLKVLTSSRMFLHFFALFCLNGLIFCNSDVCYCFFFFFILYFRFICSFLFLRFNVVLVFTRVIKFSSARFIFFSKRLLIEKNTSRNGKRSCDPQHWLPFRRCQECFTFIEWTFTSRSFVVLTASFKFQRCLSKAFRLGSCSFHDT